jgi:hypothetical protein
MNPRFYPGWWLLSLLLLCGCSLHLVADYDPQIVNQLEVIDRKIEHLYLTMQILEPDQRQYDRFSEQYLNLLIDIRLMERRQARRKNNSESLKQAKLLLQFWQQDMLSHQQHQTLSNFLIKRRLNQYRRLIDALIDGELAKQ